MEYCSLDDPLDGPVGTHLDGTRVIGGDVSKKNDWPAIVSIGTGIKFMVES